MPSRYDNLTKEQLVDLLVAMDAATTWGTSCMNCGTQLNLVYELDATINKIGAMLEQHNVPAVQKLIEPHLWSNDNLWVAK